MLAGLVSLLYYLTVYPVKVSSQRGQRERTAARG
jgi:hypothetical protein